MATLPIIDRTRLIMDVIKDGTVANLSNYASVELIDANEAIFWADLVWAKFSSVVPADPASPTNAEKARNYINWLRRQHKQLEQENRIPVARVAAEVAERATIDVEFESKLGADE